jgi:hypothetical protein
MDAKHVEHDASSRRGAAAGITLGIREKRQQKVLGTDVLVMQPRRFLARIAEHPA